MSRLVKSLDRNELVKIEAVLDHIAHLPKEALLAQNIDQSELRRVITTERERILQSFEKIEEKKQELGMPVGDLSIENDRRIITGYEVVGALYAHRDNRRFTGEPASIHLLGTLDGCTTYSYVGLGTRLAAVNHDRFEDTKTEETPKALFWSELYRHMLRSPYGSGKLERLTKEVFEAVKGVTNIMLFDAQMKRQVEEERDQNFANLLTVGRKNMRAVILRLMDRRHNMLTIKGIPRKERRIEIAEETVAVHRQMAASLRMYELEEEYIRLCLPLLNDQLLDDFNKRVAAAMRKFSGAEDRNWKTIMRKFESTGWEVELAPARLAHFINRASLNGSLDNLRIGDMVSGMDTLYTIRIRTPQPKDIGEAIRFIQENFRDDAMRIEYLPSKRGVLVRTSHQAFGGKLVFEINDRQSATLARRGRLVESSSHAMPPDMREGADHLLTISGPSRRGILKLARERWLKDNITVFTPKGERFELPRGANVRDFAMKIHGRIGLEAVGAYATSDLWDEDRRPISLYDVVEDGMMIEVERSPENSQVDAGISFFLQPRGAQIVRRELRSDPKLGQDYLKRISRVFGISFKDIKQLLISEPSLSKKSDAELKERVRTGEINLISILSQAPQFKVATLWKLEVAMLNRPGEFARFSSILESNRRVNIDSTQQPRGKKININFLEIKYDPQQMSSYEFLKLILRLNYEGFKIKLRPLRSDEGVQT